MPESTTPKRLSAGSLVVLLLAFSGMLYGTTYQQFRHFDWKDDRGQADAASYQRMSRGDYTVQAVHAYRPVVPWLAGALRNALPTASGTRPDDPKELDKLAFYVVNFGFMLVAALLLFAILRELRFDPLTALLGVAIFLSSRVTVAATGTPLTDSYYLAGIAAIVWLCLRPTRAALLLTVPLVILSKEAIYPLVLLPLFRREARTRLYAVSVLASIALVVIVRAQITAEMLAAGVDEPENNLFAVIAYDLTLLRIHVPKTFLPRGLHDLFHGYTVFAFFAAFGWWRDRKREVPRVPAFLGWLVPLTLFYAMLSGTRGRLFFGSFPVVLPYALLFLEDARRRLER